MTVRTTGQWQRVLAGGLLMAMGACGDAEPEEEETVHPKIVQVGGKAEALTSNAVTAMNGTYTTCLERSGSWSVRLSGTDPLDNPELSVIKGDTNCVLKLTAIVAGQTFLATPPLTLGASYQASTAAFAVSGGTTAFYANAKLDLGGFGTDFAIGLLHSGDPYLTDAGTISATYATVQSSGQAVLIPPPDHTISFTGASPLTVQLDANKVVTSVAGSATLIAGLLPGGNYMIDQGTLPASPTYAQVQGVFTGPGTNITSASQAIPASQFGLVGVSLASPVVRTVIVGRLLNGLLGYQLIKVTFKSP